MSRIGKKPITVPAGVDVKIDGATVTVTMPDSDVTLTAYATIQTFIITITQGANGVISVSGKVINDGKVTVNYGEDVTFTFMPNNGYHLESILVNGAQVDVSQTYTLTSVKQDYTLTATFAKDVSTDEPDQPDKPVVPNKPTTPDNPPKDKDDTNTGIAWYWWVVGPTVMIGVVFIVILLVGKKKK